MMKKFIQNLLRRDEGISALEYALIAALVALAIIVGATTLGSQMNTSLGESAVILDENTPQAAQ